MRIITNKVKVHADFTAKLKAILEGAGNEEGNFLTIDETTGEVGFREPAETLIDIEGVHTSTQVIAGDGMSGGGNLSSDVTLNVDATVVRTSGDQTIEGNKTFTEPVILASPGIANTHAVRADREIITVEGLEGGRNLRDDVTIGIADYGIENIKLNNKVVDTRVLDTDAVTTPKIENKAVTDEKLDTDSVITVKIKDGNVTEDKLGTDSVTRVKIKDGEVVRDKLATDSVTTIKIRNDAVTTPKILNRNVTAEKIAEHELSSEHIVLGSILEESLDPAFLNTVVRTSGAQNVGGVKTFSSIPKLPSTLPTQGREAASKNYVDGEVATRAPLSHTHPFTQITGTAIPDQIPNLDIDKINDLQDELDGKGTKLEISSKNVPFRNASGTGEADSGVLATSEATSNTIPLRDGSGRIRVGAPSNNADASTKKYVDDGLNTKVNTSLLGAADGVATLDGSGHVPISQLPSYVSDVFEYANVASFPDPGESNKIYVAKDSELTYRWSGSGYVEISPSIALGETDNTAYRGDRGKIAYDHSQVVTGNPHNVTAAEVGAPTSTDFTNHINDDGNPHSVTKSQVGLGNVTNHAQVRASDVDTGTSLGTSDTKVPSQKAVKTYVDNHANDTSNPHNVTSAQVGAPSTTDFTNHINDDGNPHDVTKAQVGLGNVTNDAQLKITDRDTNVSLGTSDTKVPSQKAVKTYVDNVTGGISTLQLGTTSTTAYRGDRGKIAYDHVARSDNPHGVTAAQVGARPDDWVPEWSDVQDKPGTFPPSSHTHNASDINAGTLSTSRIPDLDADKITSGTLSTSRIPDLDADKITSGTLSKSRLPSLDAYDVGARPDNWVPSWGDVTGKPGTFPPSGHTHTMGDITGLSSALNDKVDASSVGAPSGVAELDSSGLVPASQLPSYVDDVLEFADLSSFPATGESGKIYVAKDSNIIYRWSGTGYTEISSTIALGVTSSTAYRGDRGLVAYNHSQLTSGNPHNVTAAETGAPGLASNNTFTGTNTFNGTVTVGNGNELKYGTSVIIDSSGTLIIDGGTP